jgi:hypothetical protein
MMRHGKPVQGRSASYVQVECWHILQGVKLYHYSSYEHRWDKELFLSPQQQERVSFSTRPDLKDH